MLTVNIHGAKTHLARLVERAAKGEPFVIAKTGKPLVKSRHSSAGSGAAIFGWIPDFCAAACWITVMTSCRSPASMPQHSMVCRLYTSARSTAC